MLIQLPRMGWTPPAAAAGLTPCGSRSQHRQGGAGAQAAKKQTTIHIRSIHRNSRAGAMPKSLV
jgi:hypothetical protein